MDLIKSFPSRVEGWLNIWEVDQENVPVSEWKYQKGVIPIPDFQQRFCILMENDALLYIFRNEEEAASLAIPSHLPRTRLDSGFESTGYSLSYYPIDHHGSLSDLGKDMTDVNNDSLPDYGQLESEVQSLNLTPNEMPATATENSDSNLISGVNCEENDGPSQPIPVLDERTAVEHLIIYRDYDNGIYYRMYDTEVDMPNIMTLITKDLSEPYSIYTYRYFIHNWPRLCILAFTIEEEVCVGAIVCKLEWHQPSSKRGYIAMLAVEQEHRRKRIGSSLVKLVIDTMAVSGCDEVVLETEITNKPAMQLYEKLGFCRDKRLFRYYLNGVDAYRLKLWLK